MRSADFGLVLKVVGPRPDVGRRTGGVPSSGESQRIGDPSAGQGRGEDRMAALAT